MTETVIKGSRLKVMLLLAICLIFTAMGVYLLGDPSVSPVMAWLCVGLFGLGCAALLLFGSLCFGAAVLYDRKKRIDI
jgi:hypothetical protein